MAGVNFSVKALAKQLPADQAIERYRALQNSGQYSELRILKHGRSDRYTITGYRWPSKKMRRKAKMVTNPIPPKPTYTPNQVQFGQNGKIMVGWIHRETPTYYEITYKIGHSTHTVRRRKDKVKFMRTGKRGKVKNACITEANPTSPAISKALEKSLEFHKLDPKGITKASIVWPKALVVIGKCPRVDYWSDKWTNEMTYYYHKFSARNDVKIMFDPTPQPDGSSLLVIKGNFKIKPEGITG